jgi:excisionase family DNA binding protein
MPTTLNNLLTIPEAAKLLGVSVNTLRQWVCQRRLPTIKRGKAVRFSPEDLQKFIEANRREAMGALRNSYE